MRISFAGGGTDLEPYVSDYGSYVFSAAIKLYARAFAPAESTQGTVIEEILSDLSLHGKVRIVGDMQRDSGLGGSASCFVAGLKALYPQLDSLQIAKMAVYFERKVLKYSGGVQDQVCAASGGILFMTFENNDWSVERLSIESDFNKYLVLIYTGKREHFGGEVIDDILRRNNVKALHRQKQLARLMKEAVVQKRLDDFGKLLDESWQKKKEQTEMVSNSNIDSLYSKCLEYGAIGGVLTGAGAGGYMLFMEDPNKEGELRDNLIKNNIAYHNVEFDMLGVRIV